MKLFNVVNPFKALILDEALLTNEFSIGFELEGIVDHEQFPSTGLPGYHSGDEARGGAKKLLDTLNGTLGLGEGNIMRDSSVFPQGRVRTASGHEYRDDETGNGWGFEYTSPVIKFTPTNLNKILKFLKGLKDIGVKTNQHCGFHTHISYPDISKKSIVWALFCIANDENMYREVEALDEGDYKIEFSTQPYATNQMFKELQNLGDQLKNNRSASARVSNEKYLMMRIHPQGTLEWRGPRNFINDGTESKLIVDYLKKLHKVISFIADVVTRKEFNGFDREKVLSRISFSIQFDSDYEKKVQKKGQGLMTSVEKDPSKIAKMPDKILRTLFAMNDSQLDHLLGTRGPLAQYLKSNMENIDPKQIEKIINYSILSSAGNYTIMSFLTEISNQYDLLAPHISECIVKSMQQAGRSLKEISPDILKKMMVKDREIIVKLYDECENVRGIFDFLKTNQKYLPMSIYIKIAKNDPTMLIKFDSVPRKVQMILTRGTPYAIQYIRNPDPVVVEKLKAKYGEEINDYILDEV